MKLILLLAYLFILSHSNLLGDLKITSVRVAAYNVEFSKNASAEEIGDMLKPYKLDIIGFNEAPDGDWTKKVGDVLGMQYYYVGKISSANHKDKYKTILSHTPLVNMQEFPLEGKKSWNPASAVKAETVIDGQKVVFYSLHICRSSDETGHAFRLATSVLSNEGSSPIIVVGDFNNNIGDTSLNYIEKAGFKSTWTDLAPHFSNTFTYIYRNEAHRKKYNSKEAPIDHIFHNISGGGKVTDGGIIELDKALSDHKPVWAQIDFLIPKK